MYTLACFACRADWECNTSVMALGRVERRACYSDLRLQRSQALHELPMFRRERLNKGMRFQRAEVDKLELLG